MASEAAYDTAKQWISDCLFNYGKCPGRSLSDEAILPTRVLDLSADCGPGRVRLHEGLSEEKGQYVALSYCWGKTGQYMTTEKTLKSFMNEGIEISLLPKTLQDAISSTKQLGISYLWIDSLCIIQDSDADKTHEITLMPQVYRNAIVTISAASASDCGQRFLEDRKEVQTRLRVAICLPFFLTDDAEKLQNDSSLIGEVILCADENIRFNVKEFEDEPINLRAWTLQETWLSSRLLIYGSGPLKWQCLSKLLTHGENLLALAAAVVRSYYTLFPKRDKFFIDESQEISQESSELPLIPIQHDTYKILDEWHDLVSSYSRRSLTVPEDKLPALSGIAAEFHRLTNDTYLAGIWQKS